MAQDEMTPRPQVTIEAYRRDPEPIIRASEAAAIDVVTPDGRVYMTLGPLWSAMDDE